MKPEGNNIFLVSNDEWHFVFRGLLMGYCDARKNKGTRYAIRKLHAQMQSISNNFSKEAYVAKFDLKGFFMSLRRDLLWEEVKYYLTEFYPKRGVEYEVVSFLWHEIIMDDPIVGVKRRGDLRLFRLLPGRRIMGEFGLEVKNGNNVNLERLQSYFGSMRSFKAKKMLVVPGVDVAGIHVHVVGIGAAVDSRRPPVAIAA